MSDVPEFLEAISGRAVERATESEHFDNLERIAAAERERRNADAQKSREIRERTVTIIREQARILTAHLVENGCEAPTELSFVKRNDMEVVEDLSRFRYRIAKSFGLTGFVPTTYEIHERIDTNFHSRYRDSLGVNVWPVRRGELKYHTASHETQDGIRYGGEAYTGETQVWALAQDGSLILGNCNHPGYKDWKEGIRPGDYPYLTTWFEADDERIASINQINPSLEPSEQVAVQDWRTIFIEAGAGYIASL